MPRVVPILAGAAFTVVVCTAAGIILLRLLRIVLDRTEEVLFAFVGGSAVVSTLVFVLCCIRQARLGVFLIGGAALVSGAVFTRRTEFPQKWSFSRQKWLFLALICSILLVYLANALAPEVSPDGSGYHLGNVRRYFEARGFVWDYHSIYSSLSQGIEMLYLVGYAIGGMPAAATVHLAFLCALALLIACYGRRFGFPRAAMFAAVLVFASPVVGLVGVSAYNDVALATCIFAVFYLLQVHNENSSGRLLIVGGLLAGFCYGLKYPGGLVLPFALVLLKGRGVGRFAPAAALTALPWILRNWFWLGNPFAPFFNRWFPNPFYSAEAEASYLRELRVVDGLQHWWQVPLDLTMHGGILPGFLGPVFLLSPLALLALRFPHGRRLLAGAAVFAIPAVLNPGARFLIPALPFLALALGLGIGNSPGVIPALATCHVVLSFPAVMPTYCAPWAWRIRETPARVALGLAPENPYINRYLPDYWLKEALEREVPKQQKVFSLAGRPEAYIDRLILVGYESAEGLRATQLLSSPAPGPALKAMGIGFVLFNDDFKFPGLTLIEERNGTRFYRID